MGLFSFAKKKQPKISTVTTEKKKTFGIAFAGGGGRGYAHIGALKALEENNIPRANVVSGTSVGSIIGSAYALGYRADEIYEYAKEVSIESFSYRGLLGVDKLSKLLDKDVRSRFFNITRDSETIEKIMTNFYGKKAFCNTLSEFYTNAVDLYTGKEVILDSGSIAKACRASSSVPGVFICCSLTGEFLIICLLILSGISAMFSWDLIFITTRIHLRRMTILSKSSRVLLRSL